MPREPLDEGYKNSALIEADRLRDAIEKGDTYLVLAYAGNVIKEYNLARHWGIAEAEGRVIQPHPPSRPR